jgi:hypothetical protein
MEMPTSRRHHARNTAYPPAETVATGTASVTSSGVTGCEDGSMSDSAVSFSLTERRRHQMPSNQNVTSVTSAASSNLTSGVKSGSVSQIPVVEGGKRLGRTLSFDQSEEANRSTGNHVGKRSHRHKADGSNGGDSLTSYKSDSTLASSVHDASDSGQFGSFVEGLGPGQIVGRQVLGSPCMGEVQLSIADRKGQLEVEVIRARALCAKPGAKVLPAPYVKVYLMDGKTCVEKQKTVTARRTLDPLYQQQLCFTMPYNGKILQVTVWGDYGRSDRKVFMGVVQIKLDSLDLTSMAIGWYKLFSNLSLVSVASATSHQSSTSLQRPASASSRS